MTRPGDCPTCGVGLPQHAVGCTAPEVVLAEGLRAFIAPNDWAGVSWQKLALSIINHPQSHMDLLFNASVVEKVGDNYRVVTPPHKHVPDRVWVTDSGATVVGCRGCNVMVEVEWPT